MYDEEELQGRFTPRFLYILSYRILSGDLEIRHTCEGIGREGVSAADNL